MDQKPIIPLAGQPSPQPAARQETRLNQPSDPRLESAVDRVRQQLTRYRQEGLRLCSSSSFQTHSIPLLHLIARFAPDTPVYFLDTGFHFPETLTFRDRIAADLDLNVIDLRSAVGKMGQRDTSGQFLFASDPDHCCYLNKTQPMQAVLPAYDIWIAGLRRDQNAHRKNLAAEMPGTGGVTRFHPVLEWDARLIWAYRKLHDLPEHPLEAKGYFSVGCEPCTQKFDLEFDPASATDRGGRWAGMKKTECGLHTDLVASNPPA